MAPQQSVKLPEKLLCRVCAKWKKKTQFSNKELGKFTYWNQQNGAPTTPMTAKLRCRGCAGGSVSEMECLGPCAETKLLSEFSKAARKNGGSNWCVVCTLWKESSEHNVSVQPPPKCNSPGNLSENRAYDSLEPNDLEYSDPEAGDGGSDYDDISHISGLISSFEIASSYTGDGGSETSVSNMWEDASSFATSGSGSGSGSGSTRTLSQRLQPTAYNTWEPSGNRHRMNQQQTLETGESQSTSNHGHKYEWIRPIESQGYDGTQQSDQLSRSRPWKTIRKKASENLIDL